MFDDINKSSSENENYSGAFVQTIEQEDLIRKAIKLLNEGKEARKKYDKDWNEFQDFYDGNQWRQKRASYKSSPVINLVYPVIETSIPILTDGAPSFSASPSDPSDYDFADTISKMIDSFWQNYAMHYTDVEALYDSHILGTAIAKVTFDKTLDDGIGDVKINILNPREIYVPKNAIDFDKNCDWVIHLVNKDVDYIKGMFPEYKNILVSDNKANENPKNMNGGVVSPVDQKDKNPPSDSGTPEENTIQILELWIRDKTLEQLNDETGKQISKKKFPNGRLVVIALSQKIVLQDLENPYEHAMWPFVKLNNYIRQRSFWGRGEAEPLIELNKGMNKTTANILDYMNFCGNPVWINGADTGIDSDKITNQVGLILRPNAGTRLDRLIPPPLPSYNFEFQKFWKDYSDTISGVFDITQGRRPEGITAASAITTLQEAAQTRIRLKDRNHSVFLQKLGKQVVFLMLQYYTAPKVLRITGKENWQDVFEFHVSKTEDGKKILNKRKYIYDEASKTYNKENNVQQKEMKGIFDIIVQSGTAMPYNKANKINTAFKLFELGVIDKEALLEATDFPNAEEITRRMQEAEQNQLQNQLQNSNVQPIAAQAGV